MPASRIVSLLPSASEIVCAVGAERELVGISHECDFPPAIRDRRVLTRSRIDVHGTSRAIDTTHERVMDTTEFIQRKVIEPARELAAILAGVRRGLEVLVAPTPSPVDRSYGDEELSIG